MKHTKTRMGLEFRIQGLGSGYGAKGLIGLKIQGLITYGVEDVIRKSSAAKSY